MSTSDSPEQIVSSASTSHSVVLHPSYAIRSSSDVDEHATYISSWHQEYDQLSQGRFQGSVRELLLDEPRMQVYHEYTRPRTGQRCQPWTGSVWFGIPDNGHHEPVYFSGLRQPGDGAGVLMSASANEGFVLRTPQEFGIRGVVMAEEWLWSKLDSLGVSGPRTGASRNDAIKMTVLAPRQHVALCATIDTILSLAAGGEAAQLNRQAQLDALIDLMVIQLSCTTDDESSLRQTRSAMRRVNAVMQARSLVKNALNDLNSIDALCAHLHVTPRTLQNHFQSVVGEAPMQYLRAVRLNACRRDLRSGQHATVQQVAAQWGFFHMGRFAQEYKMLFGESPARALNAS